MNKWLLTFQTVLLVMLINGFTPCAWGGQTTESIASAAELPNAPAMQDSTANSPSPSPQPALASIAGTVFDVGGSIVPGAKVTLLAEPGGSGRSTLTNSKGEFTFTELPPGSFKITITSAQLEASTSDVSVLAGEQQQMPPITLAVAMRNTEISVVASQDEVAVAQVKAAEQQRILGTIPNFYSSYIWNAAPLRPKLKFELAFRSVTDPVTFIGSAGTAGVEQAMNTFPGYGSGPGAYAKRFGATYSDTVISRMLGSAILPSLLHQDPRYFYKGTGSIPSRAFYAISQTFVTRGDNGRSQPNYSHLLGNFATAGISTIYHSPSDRTASLAIRNGFIITAGNAAINLIREFVLHGVTSKIPDYPQGKQ